MGGGGRVLGGGGRVWGGVGGFLGGGGRANFPDLPMIRWAGHMESETSKNVN